MYVIEEGLQRKCYNVRVLKNLKVLEFKVCNIKPLHIHVFVLAIFNNNNKIPLLYFLKFVL